MIAKSIFLLLLFGSSFLLYSQAESQHKNKYVRIAEEYDIHPPQLEYGYPVWYHTDTLTAMAVIFLTKNMDTLQRADATTYIAAPSAVHAQQIFLNCEKTGYSQKIYIIPDSDLGYKDIDSFLRAIFPCYVTAEVLFVGKNFRYTPIKFGPWCYPGAVCPAPIHNRDILKIECVEGNEILVEGKRTLLDSLPLQVERFYFENYYEETNYNLPIRETKNLEEIRKKIALLDSIQATESSDIRKYYLWDIETQRVYEKLAISYGKIHCISSAARISFWNLCNVSVVRLFELLNFVNKGVYICRQKKCLDFFEVDYKALFHYNRWKDLNFIHFEFPDLVLQDINSAPPRFEPLDKLIEYIEIDALTNIVDSL